MLSTLAIPPTTTFPPLVTSGSSLKIAVVGMVILTLFTHTSTVFMYRATDVLLFVYILYKRAYRRRNNRKLAAVGSKKKTCDRVSTRKSYKQNVQNKNVQNDSIVRSSFIPIKLVNDFDVRQI